MKRRQFLKRSVLYHFLSIGAPWTSWLRAQKPTESAASPTPIPEPHFPHRLHLFIWRNWELVNAERLALVLGTTTQNVLELGASMGLPKKTQLSEDQLRRIYITVIRQNWHILPHDQLMQLLGWSRERYEYILEVDDFLGIKLTNGTNYLDAPGSMKPRCDRLHYEPPSAEMRQRATEIRKLVRATFDGSLDEAGEPPFHFVHELSSTRQGLLRDIVSRPTEDEVDLSYGWTLIKPRAGSEIPPGVAERFQAYLRSAFNCEIGLAERKEPPFKVLQFVIDPSILETPESFQLDVHPQGIRLVGRDAGGLLQGFYYLQDRMEERDGPFLPTGALSRATHLNPRYIYPYFALYGDPLLEPEIDPLPEGFMERLARAGVNGVWLQAVLRNLAPSKIFPEFGTGWEQRIGTLNKLVQRASSFGMKIYLYIDEPRAMPAEFFADRPEIKGTHDPDMHFFALCTSVPEVRRWISDSLAHVFSQVPGLGGVFIITATENLTNCFCHGRAQFCPRCSKRRGWEVVPEVIHAIRDGVRRSSRNAEIIVWDWGWGDMVAAWVASDTDPTKIIPRLPRDVDFLSVSEYQVVDRGGFTALVDEYSISAVGPGPHAMREWNLAQQMGLKTFAKVQFNNTWEISAVPYIPVPHLIVEHCENLLKAGIQGLMLSWTLGGYPSPNLEVAKECYFSPAPAPGQALGRVAARRYGRNAAPFVVSAWETFSTAFQEFPFGAGLYLIPTQHGAANLLRLNPTGYTATGILFPYDDLKSWTKPYPVEVVQKQYEKMARLWDPGLERFREALPRVPAHKQTTARKDLGIAETCYLHFRSVSNQIRFYQLRRELESSARETRSSIVFSMKQIAQDEIEMAKRQYAIAKQDSTIAFEAADHYYYRPLDLIEKVLNCEQIIRELSARLATAAS